MQHQKHFVVSCHLFLSFWSNNSASQLSSCCFSWYFLVLSFCIKYFTVYFNSVWCLQLYRRNFRSLIWFNLNKLFWVLGERVVVVVVVVFQRLIVHLTWTRPAKRKHPLGGVSSLRSWWQINCTWYLNFGLNLFKSRLWLLLRRTHSISLLPYLERSRNTVARCHHDIGI